MGLIGALLFVLVWSGCKRELDSSWDVNYYGPVGQTQITLDKMLPDNSIAVGDDSLLSLVFTDTLFSLEIDSLMGISDTLSANQLDVPVTLNLPPGQKVLESTDENRMDLGDALFTMVSTEKALIRIETYSSVTQPLLMRYVIPSAKKNGVPYEVELTIPAAQDTVPVIQVDYMNLEGYDFDFTGQSGHEVNTLVAKTEVWVHPEADNLTVNAGDKIYITTFLEDLSLAYAKGYFGSDNFHIQAREDIDLFKFIPTGSLIMDSIKGSIQINNNVGMDAQLTLNQLDAHRVVPQLTHTIGFNHSLIGQDINISRATDVWGQITPFQMNIDLDHNNLHDIIMLMPNELSYDMMFKMNPLGNVSLGNDFLYAGRGMDVILELETPLNISIDNLIWLDTMDLDVEQLKGVQSGSFKLHTSNMLPYDLNVQMYLMDEDGVVTDSLQTNGVSIYHAQLNGQNQSMNPTDQTHDIVIDADKIEHLRNADRIILKVFVNNPQAQQIYTLRANNYLDMKLIADFVYRINEKE
jgi:hypothetical protein